jgi:hypothetical protein
MTELASTLLKPGNGRSAVELRLSDARRQPGLLTSSGNKSGGMAEPGITSTSDSNSAAALLISRVEAFAVQNGVNLAAPVGKGVLHGIANQVGATDAETFAAIEHLRAERGVTCSIESDATPPAEEVEDEPWCGFSDDAGPVDPELSPRQTLLLQELQRRGVDLAQPVSEAVVDEVMPLVQLTKASIRSALQRIRKRLGIQCARPIPPRPQRRVAAHPADTGEVSRKPADHFVDLGETVVQSAAPPRELLIPTDPHTLAVLLVNELREVGGPSRPAALIEAAKLLRRTLR